MAGKPRVKANAIRAVEFAAEFGISLDQIQPDSSGWITVETVTDAVMQAYRAAVARERETAAAQTMSPEEAYRTGRVHASSLPAWRERYQRDPDGTGRTLAGLAPVLAIGAAGAGGSAVPELSLIDQHGYATWGPDFSPETRAYHNAITDQAGERAFTEQLEAERAAVAANQLTEAEYRALYPDDGPDGS